LGITPGGEVLFQTWAFLEGRWATHVRRMPLTAARAFASHEPDPPVRTAEDWRELVERIIATEGGDAGLTRPKRTPEDWQRLAQTFVRLYRERFGNAAPDDLTGFEHQLQELQALSLPAAARQRLALILGAVHGDYLCRRHGAVWRLVDGPLSQPEKRTVPSDPFGYAVNPFRSLHSSAGPGGSGDEEDEPVMWSRLRNILTSADGRTIVLTNDPDRPDATAFLADPDLARAEALLKLGNGAVADRILLDMMKWRQHERNSALLIHVGKLLHDHKRGAALNTLMTKHCPADSTDPRKYNLLGLALLDADPNAAAVQFKNALRCNLRYGPAYFNLATACEKSGNRLAAIQCLRRYLKLLGYSPLVEDARQRLAALEDDDGAP
jgi:hypothetical protein